MIRDGYGSPGREKGVRLERLGAGVTRVHGRSEDVRGDLSRWLREEVESWTRQVNGHD